MPLYRIGRSHISNVPLLSCVYARETLATLARMPKTAVPQPQRTREGLRQTLAKPSQNTKPSVSNPQQLCLLSDFQCEGFIVDRLFPGGQGGARSN
jgi:hypothetical protein